MNLNLQLVGTSVGNLIALSHVSGGAVKVMKPIKKVHAARIQSITFLSNLMCVFTVHGHTSKSDIVKPIITNKTIID